MECKNYSENQVVLKDATHFVHKLKELNIKEGIFVANRGFTTDAAKTLGNEKVIMIQSLRELAELGNNYNYSSSGRSQNNNRDNKPSMDYYKILGISPNASQEVIKWVKDGLVRKWHPDNHPNEDPRIYNQKMQEINEAYEILSDPVKRKEYDEQFFDTNEEVQNGAQKQDYGRDGNPFSNDFKEDESRERGSEHIKNSPITKEIIDRRKKIILISIAGLVIMAGIYFAITNGMTSTQQKAPLTSDQSSNSINKQDSVTKVDQVNPAVSVSSILANTTMTLRSSANPTAEGNSITITADLTTTDFSTPKIMKPIGIVQFNVDGTNFRARVNLSNGQASFTIPSITAGSHTIEARYLGDNNFAPSKGILSQTVEAKIKLTTLLDDSFNNGYSGWTLFGTRTKPITLAFDLNQGQPSPSIMISYTTQSSSFLADQPFEDAGIQKTADISTWNHRGPLVLSFEYRAKSSEPRFAKMNVLILDGNTGNTIFTKNTNFEEGDTGWRTFSAEISSAALNVSSIKIIMWFNDVGRTSANWYDNIKLQASTNS